MPEQTFACFLPAILQFAQYFVFFTDFPMDDLLQGPVRQDSFELLSLVAMELSN